MSTPQVGINLTGLSLSSVVTASSSASASSLPAVQVSIASVSRGVTVGQQTIQIGAMRTPVITSTTQQNIAVSLAPTGLPGAPGPQQFFVQSTAPAASSVPLSWFQTGVTADPNDVLWYVIN